MTPELDPLVILRQQAAQSVEIKTAQQQNDLIRSGCMLGISIRTASSRHAQIQKKMAFCPFPSQARSVGHQPQSLQASMFGRTP